MAIEDLIPRVEVTDPGLAYVPVAGAVRYYGGEELLVAKVAGVIPPGGQLGVAEGPFAARCAAERAQPGTPLIVGDTPRFLAGLEIESLGVQELADTFKWLGVTTLGDLAGLPREALASRFGSVGIDAHRLASGDDRAPQPRRLPPELAVESTHDEEPLLTADQVAFATRALAIELIRRLSEQGVGVFRVLVEVEAADGTRRSRMWRSTYPFTDQALTERVWWQVRAWTDTPQGVPGGIARIRLDPAEISDEGKQLLLLEEVDGTWRGAGSTGRDTERALARAQALVGPDAVLQAVHRGGRMPHEQVEWFPWGDRTPDAEPQGGDWPGRTPGPSPALASATPPRVEVEWEGGMPVRMRLASRWEPVLSWSGPWRMVGRWWQGEPSVDRYQVVTSAGAVLCVVREGQTYLAGVYD